MEDDNIIEFFRPIGKQVVEPLNKAVETIFSFL